jgi:murein DD-endopeptidase MepM/ murein hydrolase activator NlpD
VIVVIRSNSGFGNHVIVDHGNGLTSLYGHMYATAVQVGQVVDKNTVLGYEGTTGASTGVHVHFEIDLNSQPVNPHLYVTGHP